MNRRRFLLGVIAWLALGNIVLAADKVRKVQGATVGAVSETSELEIKVARGAKTETFPVNQVEWIEYDGEPAALTAARVAIQAGQYEDGLEGLENIKPAEVKRPEVQQDIDFYKALCAARIALTAGGNILEAGTRMNAFVQANPKSYHFLQACEMLGDLYVAVRQYDKALALYAKVGQAPWPDYCMRAGVAAGRALLAQGKTADAMRSFDEVLATSAPGLQAERQRLAASLGKARCLADGQKHDEAIRLVQEIIAKANPEETEILATAYNALGEAYRKAGRAKDAILAYLQVDVLYFNSRRDHIEALENLVALWNEVQKPERAADAAQILKERYRIER